MVLRTAPLSASLGPVGGWKPMVSAVAPVRQGVPGTAQGRPRATDATPPPSRACTAAGLPVRAYPLGAQVLHGRVSLEESEQALGGGWRLLCTAPWEATEGRGRAGGLLRQLLGRGGRLGSRAAGQALSEAAAPRPAGGAPGRAGAHEVAQPCLLSARTHSRLPSGTQARLWGLSRQTLSLRAQGQERSSPQESSSELCVPYKGLMGHTQGYSLGSTCSCSSVRVQTLPTPGDTAVLVPQAPRGPWPQ